MGTTVYMGFHLLVLQHVFREANIVQHEPTWEPKRAILGSLGAVKPYFRNNCVPQDSPRVLYHPTCWVVNHSGAILETTIGPEIRF